MSAKALIFDIKRDASADGPGIRTTVFFKGCPLACGWCQNPESKATEPEMAFLSERCDFQSCGQPCLAACKQGALAIDAHGLTIDRARCQRCGQCAAACPSHALQTVGEWLTVDELYYRVAIDKPFFAATGGGVTASGGECTMQMDFLGEFFAKLKANDIHTAIETNGLFNFERFSRLLLPRLDLIYFDLKLFDEAASIRYTGHSNRPILANLIRLVQTTTIPLKVRVPLIPDVTATDENLKAIAQFLRAQGIGAIEALPYNPLWLDKLARFDTDARYNRRSFMTDKEIQHCINCLQAA